jgi:hypothetical protein
MDCHRTKRLASALPIPACSLRSFPKPLPTNGVERHVIDVVDVSIFGVAKIIADLFAIAALSVSTSRSKACGRHSENAVSCVALIEHPQELRP